MRRFLINFRQTARERAAVLSTRAYNHYLRIKPFVGRILSKYGSYKKGVNFPRQTSKTPGTN